jgi:exosome complex component RRP4
MTTQTSELIAKDKQIAVPGETLATGMEFLPSAGTYRINEKILANKLGVLNVDGKVLKIIPVSGRYFPRKGDVIIGKVVDLNFNGWRVNINCAYEAMLSVKDATSDFIRRGENLTKFFDINDYMVTQIVNVTSQNLVDLTLKGPGLKKLYGGRILEVNTHKVPRIIGKQGSMVSMIKEATGCKITVGQNGFIWISGSPEGEILSTNVIKRIESESHQSGLTDKIKEYLDKNRVVPKQEISKSENTGAENTENTDAQSIDE